ncbi:hypothetical protein EXE58_06360 [Nocardioides seonyuensis]|uniref:Uncharacterized protein n=1 Tax=Nocardioides seonyuensis TaxID=2518371 RepID=A0A4P7ID86_9ACTN|nr:hypothetical protein [Nocardioides seonyuensis]QBX55115.1 hypothetical protein EXE58_06360 [Nocardioides seonyuensis]
MSFDLTPLFGFSFLGILTFTMAGGLLALHLKNRVPGLGVLDGLRAVAYLTQYDAALEYHGLRSRERRARVDELRANLAESAADGGVAAAIHRLGPPRVLASEVAGARMVPSWSRGTLWLAIAVGVAALVLATSTSAFLAGVDSVASGGDATWSTLFVTMTASTAPSGSSTFAVELQLVALVLLLVPFLLGARVWRLRAGNRSDRVSNRSH